MNAMVKTLRFTAALMLLTGLVTQSAKAATTYTTSGYISQLIVGCNTPNLLITTDGIFSNPDQCPSTDGYYLPPDSAANQQITAAAMTAYVMKQKVKFVIDGCSSTRPKIIGTVLNSRQ